MRPAGARKATLEVRGAMCRSPKPLERKKGVARAATRRIEVDDIGIVVMVGTDV